MISGFFRISAMAANGIPQFATGPQKCVLLKLYEKGMLFSIYQTF